MTGRAVLVRAGSAPVLAALLAPVAAVGAACAAGWIGLAALAGSRTILVWLALVAGALAARGAASLMDGRAAPGLAALAAALLAAQAWVSAALTVDATIDAGEGEQSPPAAVAFAGRLATVPRVRALALQGTRGGALLATPLRELTAPIGREVEVGPGLAARVEGVFAAPVFVVRHGGGVEETVGPVMLRPGRREYFESRSLPHRFYATVAPPGDGAAASLRLRIQRGKLLVAERDLQPGQPLEFEGLAIAWTQSAPWAPIRVRFAPRPWLAAGAAALALAAVVVALRERRRR